MKLYDFITCMSVAKKKFLTDIGIIKCSALTNLYVEYTEQLDFILDTFNEWGPDKIIWGMEEIKAGRLPGTDDLIDPELRQAILKITEGDEAWVYMQRYRRHVLP